MDPRADQRTGKVKERLEMRDILLEALRSHAQGHVDKHKANVEVYLNSTTGIGEHPDIIEAMEGEIMEIAKYDDVLEMLNKYFT